MKIESKIQKFLNFRFLTPRLILLISLIHLSSSLWIDCSFSKSENSHEDFYWDVLKHAYTCYGTVTVKDPRTPLKFNTNHKPPRNNDQVHGLMIIHQRDLEAFPHGIQKTFSKLNGIDLEGCGLTSISAKDLMHFPDLLQISLDDNKITQLPHDLFTHNRKLQRIDLEGNPLLHVGSNIFKSLPELKTVYMRHTTCTSENALAFNEHERKILEWELLIECPATFEMNLEAMVMSEEFVRRVRGIIEGADGRGM